MTNDEEIPYKYELEAIKAEIGTLDINYLPLESKKITLLLESRTEKEKKAFRVTSIVKNDYLFEKSTPNKKYFATYLHDKVVDVTCNYFRSIGFDTYKEQFITSIFKNRKIKGHADIIITSKCQKMLAEVKNYTEQVIGKDEFLYFTHQILTYCTLLGIKTAFIVLNNPKRYKQVVVFRLVLTESNEKYIKDYLSRSLSIQDYIENFKYKKVIT